MTVALEARNLVAGYGKLAVVRGFDLSVDSSSVVAILGPNGAGKTTLLKTFAGLLPWLGGKVLVGEMPLRNGRAAAANRAGVVLVPDGRALFTALTVDENLSIARRRGGPSSDDMRDLFPALASRRKLTAGALSGGEQQMLAIARALVQQPRVLLIDEMSTGLAPVVVEHLLPIVRQIAKETGMAVILVEQHVRLALEIADQALVLVHGQVSIRGPAAALAADSRALEAAYLGATGEGGGSSARIGVCVASAPTVSRSPASPGMSLSPDQADHSGS
jgi:branched-chain amino acid transport system ATP-binding protein